MATTLTPSLDRALCRSALARYEQMAQQYVTDLGILLSDAYDGKWTAKRANAFWKKLHALGQRRSFGAFSIGQNAFHMTPRVRGERVTVETVRIEVPGRQLPQVYDTDGVMGLGRHAVERLFLRLNTLDAIGVRDEIRDGLLQASPLRLAALRVGAQQLAVPTAHGAFLCEVRRGQPLLARTWLRSNDPNRGAQTMNRRWEQLTAALMTQLVAWQVTKGEDAAIFMRCAATGERHGTELAELYAQVLRNFEWLQQPYVGGSDREGELWERARAQAATALAC